MELAIVIAIAFWGWVIHRYYTEQRQKAEERHEMRELEAKNARVREQMRADQLEREVQELKSQLAGDETDDEESET